MEIVKSPTWVSSTTECEVVPIALMPVIVTVYVPGVFDLIVQEAAMVEFADTLVGASGHVTVSPVEVEPDREIGPAKLLMLVRERANVPLPPEFTSSGLMLIAKSPTCMTDVALWAAVPLVAFPATLT
jgi:hypothetical protein